MYPAHQPDGLVACIILVPHVTKHPGSEVLVGEEVPPAGGLRSAGLVGPHHCIQNALHTKPNYQRQVDAHGDWKYVFLDKCPSTVEAFLVQPVWFRVQGQAMVSWGIISFL